MKNRWKLGMISAAGILFLTGCSGKESSEATYRMLYSSEVTTLNYLTTTTTLEYQIAANVQDCLVDYDQYGNIQPGLAERWESNDDMTVWTFHLRDGIKWMDAEGKAVADVTADDFVAAARYVNDAVNDASSQYVYNTGAIVHNAQAYYDYTEYRILSQNGTRDKDEEGNELVPVPEVKAEEIGVTALDQRTVVYELDRPCSYFPSLTCNTAFLPVKQEYLDKWGADFASDKDHLLYCGAYVRGEQEAPDEEE